MLNELTFQMEKRKDESWRTFSKEIWVKCSQLEEKVFVNLCCSVFDKKF